MVGISDKQFPFVSTCLKNTNWPRKRSIERRFSFFFFYLYFNVKVIDRQIEYADVEIPRGN